MTQSKHTPGPWRVSYNNGDMYLKSADGDSLMCDMTYYPWVPIKEEDWKLIAAAPDLLGTLEDALSIIKKDGEYSHGETPEDASYIFFDSTIINAIESDIEAAIAKAKGEG